MVWFCNKDDPILMFLFIGKLKRLLKRDLGSSTVSLNPHVQKENLTYLRKYSLSFLSSNNTE